MEDGGFVVVITLSKLGSLFNIGDSQFSRVLRATSEPAYPQGRNVASLHEKFLLVS